MDFKWHLPCMLRGHNASTHLSLLCGGVASFTLPFLFLGYVHFHPTHTDTQTESPGDLQSVLQELDKAG